MSMLLLGLAAVAALAALGGSKNKEPATGQDPAVTADLQKLYAANVTTYQAVIQVLGSGGNPAMLIQYALQLNALYPALSKKLADMAQSEMIPVTGASGTQWNTWGSHDPTSNISNVDILLGGMPVMSYQQTGSDKSTRKFLGAASGVDSATLARARADFGV